ncbi:MAG: ABC transporter ATP-binding protein/permease [Acidobacteria bacterium]|nr:ABC transporter ATP-binding protein/permease [Acidobacteriota bacterium]
MRTTSPDHAAGVRSKPVIRLLRRYAWRYRWSYLAGAGFLWLTNYLAVSIPGQIGHAIDALRASQPLGRNVAAIAVMGLAIIFVRSLSRILIFNPGRYLEYHLRQDLFAHLLRLPSAFYAGHRTGDIISRAANDIGWVRVMVGFGGLQVMNVALAVALTGWKMVALSPRLTGLTLLPIVAAVAAAQWWIRRLFTLSRQNQRQLGDISDRVLGSLQGMATIQGFTAERAFIDGFRRKNLAWLGTGMRIAVLRSLALPVLVLSGGLSLYIVIVAGAPLVESGALTVGQLAAFVALLTVLLPPLRSIGWMLSVLQRGRASLERLLELMDAPTEEQLSGSIRTASGRGPAIVLDGMTFSYPGAGGRPALEEVAAEVPGGSVVGVFGRTGSGKSTLLRLLARLEQPPPGAISVDGIDLADLDIAAWRERIVAVTQRPFLFSETMEFNVALDEHPDQQRLHRAVRDAALEPDLEALPDGLRTVVGERGIMLSGGQRQRVALARGLYRGGDLLLLDDVLSAVDHETEVRLVETLASLARSDRQPTVLIVSNRLSVLQHTDTVLVLHRGRLVDSGEHSALILRSGPYRDAWLAQRNVPPDEMASEAAS